MDRGLRKVRPLEGGLDAWIDAGGDVALFDTHVDKR
jgi:3-mercaptopyruvate sulfurtransferase SseA